MAASHSNWPRWFSKTTTASSIQTALTKLENNAGMQSAQSKSSQIAQLCCWLFTHIGRLTMAKKLSASSRPEKLKSVTSEDIKNRKWTEKEREAMRRLSKSQAEGDDSDINFEDIPPLTAEQLARMVRFRDRKKVPVSVRLDPQVLDWLKSKGEGHLTRINDILTNLMEAERRAG
jgi:uncharacterized protein (DUF4415 family)